MGQKYSIAELVIPSCGNDATVIVASNDPGVILSAAKDLLAGIERRKMILRCAQDDKFVMPFRNWEVH